MSGLQFLGSYECKNYHLILKISHGQTKRNKLSVGVMIIIRRKVNFWKTWNSKLIFRWN